MKVCYLGPFNPNSPRSRVILKGLARNGVEVEQINVFSSNQIINYFKLLKNLPSDFDIIIIGARGDYYGQPLVPLVKFITKKPVVFDAMITLYETEVLDRKNYNSITIQAKLMYFLDYFALHNADFVLTDTQIHATRFSYDYKVKRNKFRQIPVGSDDDFFYPRSETEHNDFRVMFWGTFVPLQGVKYIIEAAKMLEKHYDIKFEIRGLGQTYKENIRLAQDLGLKNVEFITDWVDYNDFPNCIASADVCLGIFGETEKAKTVIPTKAVDTLAMQKPLITGDSIAVREKLTHMDNCLLVPMSNPQAIADAILLLKNDPFLRNKIARNGNKVFNAEFSPMAIGRKLKSLLESFVMESK